MCQVFRQGLIQRLVHRSLRVRARRVGQQLGDISAHAGDVAAPLLTNYLLAGIDLLQALLDGQARQRQMQGRHHLAALGQQGTQGNGGARIAVEGIDLRMDGFQLIQTYLWIIHQLQGQTTQIEQAVADQAIEIEHCGA